MLNPSLKSIYLLDNEYKLYARQVVLSQLGIQGQKRLKSAKILFIGAGALASPAIIYLAASGIGCIGIIDDDKVNKSNLHRQIIYNQKQVNQAKVHAAKNMVNQINPRCTVITYEQSFSKNNYINIIKQYDLVIDSCDNFNTRYDIDLACYKLHKTHIYGAIREFEGQLSVYNYKCGPRYIDIYPQHFNLHNTSCNSIGVLGIIPGAIGILQATEALKIILGIGKVLSGYLFIYNPLKLYFRKSIIRRKKYTTIYNKIYTKKNINYYLNTIQESKISLDKLKLIVNKKSKDYLIIDVRQQEEFHLQHIPKAINIPIKNFKFITTVDFIRSIYISSNKTILIYCSNNVRSCLSLKILKTNNINGIILKDGFNQWKQVCKQKPKNISSL